MYPDVPKRKTNRKNFYRIPRDRKILFRKRKNIMKKVVNQPITKKLKNKLIDIEIKLKRSYQSEQQIEEQQAVDSIKNNPKSFF